MTSKPGDVFGKLTIIRRVSSSRNGATRWLCRCSCGVEREYLATHLVSRKTRSCGCDRPAGPTHKQWTGCGDISGNFFYQIRRGANGAKGRSKIPFNLTIEYLWELFVLQEKKCALTGLPLTFARRYGNKRDIPQTASLDRIDSGGDYSPGNVQWVHKDVNKMKNAFSQERYVEICLLVAKNKLRAEYVNCD
jgi:hypothetical protein